MARISTISESALDYILYGDNSHVVGNYLQQQLANMPQAFNQFAERVCNAVQQSYTYVTDTMTRYGILNQLSDKGLIANQDYIQPLTTFEQMQTASPVMQRWIMAHPRVKQLYTNQNIDGYSNTYQNVFGQGVGKDDYNYRLVMSGVLQDDGETAWRTFYNNDDLVEGDRRLNHYEKVAIINTHEAIDYLLEKNPYDFTLTSEALMRINWD